jgi:hypothetical protein
MGDSDEELRICRVDLMTKGDHVDKIGIAPEI